MVFALDACFNLSIEGSYLERANKNVLHLRLPCKICFAICLIVLADSRSEDYLFASWIYVKELMRMGGMR